METSTLVALSAAVRAAKQGLKEAQAACYAAQRAAESACRAAQAPHSERLAQIEATYRDRAHELAIEAGECPRARWGSFLDPDSVNVREDGLSLSWDINGDYAPHHFLAGWDKLLAPAAVVEAAQ